MQPERFLTVTQQHRAHLLAARDPRAIRRALADAARAALIAQRRAAKKTATGEAP